MNDTIARVTGHCSCGIEMIADEATGNGLYCPNCDRVQPQETTCPDCAAPGRCEKPTNGRVPTDRDYFFTKAWRQRVLRIYPGQNLW